jgi:hypothetical protein
MADVNTYTVDKSAIRGGEWVSVGTPPQDFEIRTRGFTPAYRDGLNSLRRHASRELNRKLRPGDVFYTPDTLPPTVDDQCQGQALADHCVLDVRGLTSGGEPVTGDQFRDLLREPEGRQGLLILAIGAAATVGNSRQAEREEAEGNS